MYFFFTSPSFSYSFSLDHPLITSAHVNKSHATPTEKYPCLNILYSPLSSSVSLHPSISLALMQVVVLDRDWSGRQWPTPALPLPLQKWMGIRCAPAMKLDAELLVTRARGRRRGRVKKSGEGRWNEMNTDSGIYPLVRVLWFPGGHGKHFIVHNVKSSCLWYENSLSLCLLLGASFTWCQWQTALVVVLLIYF